MQTEIDRIPVVGFTGKHIGWMNWPDARNYCRLEWQREAGKGWIGYVRDGANIGWAMINGQIDRAVMLRRGQAIKSLPRFEYANRD